MSTSTDGAPGLLLRLAGPLQSWGERGTFAERDTARVPTRSGLIGLFEAARGHQRGADLAGYDEMGVTVRIDRPGVRMVDFHTVGGGLPAAQTVPTAAGKRRSEGATTIVSRRHYLADAVFTVAVTAPPALLETLAAALAAPVWAPYLGRRSCPPNTPLLLRPHVDAAVAELDHVPLARAKPANADTVDVEFVYEQPPPREPARGADLELSDIPTSFAPTRRGYHPRPLWKRVRPLPADLCGGADKLLAYLEGARR